jgi:hypothetical protein
MAAKPRKVNVVAGGVVGQFEIQAMFNRDSLRELGAQGGRALCAVL